MLKLAATAVKELVLLGRDRSGLLVLFVMPAILVVVITLVQDNVLRLTGQEPTSVLYLDLDNGLVGEALAAQLSRAGLRIVKPERDQASGDDVKTAVANGDYRLGIVVPAGTSAMFSEESSRLLEQVTARGNPDQNHDTARRLPVLVWVDPGIVVALRSALINQVELALAAVTINQQLSRIEQLLAPVVSGPVHRRDHPTGSGIGLAALFEEPLLFIEDGESRGGPSGRHAYNPVQQNVPAWALFGVFFTAIPIAGGLLQERKSGIWPRLMTLPVSPLTLIAGKVLAYGVVCCCQFLLIYLIGTAVFPLVGLPAFTVSAHPVPLVSVVVLSSLAACGFGILLGVFCSSYEQASTLGATAVVVAAAVGGVMVPVYAMPPIMQQISIASPLNWSLDAFHELLVRGSGPAAIVDDLGRLTLFFVLTLGLATWKLRIRR